MNLHDEICGICDELEAGVVNQKRIGIFLEWTRKQKYSLYRRRDASGVEINPVKDAIVVRLHGVATGKFTPIESASLLRKQFALLDAPAVDDRDNELDAIALVRAIVNKVRKISRTKLSQPQKGVEIARKVDNKLWEAYLQARKLKSKDKVSHFTRLIQDCDNPNKGVPQWLKG